MTSPIANITTQIRHLDNFLLGFCHKDNLSKTQFQPNIRRKAVFMEPFLLSFGGVY